MTAKKEILKQASVYSAGTLLTQMITLVAAILSRRFLGPLQMGIWTTLQIIVDYSKYASLGIMSAVSREIPYYMGKGEEARAGRIKNLAFTFVLASSCVFSAGLLIFMLASWGKISRPMSIGLIFVSCIVFFQRYNNLLIALLRCYKKFYIETSVNVSSAIVNAVLVAFLSYRFQFYGFAAAMALSFLFNIIYITVLHRFHFKWDLDIKEMRPLLAVGVPLLLIGLLATLARSLDKILISKYLGFEELGLYSVALMAGNYMSNFSTAIGAVLYPHFQEKFGAKDNPSDLKNYLWKSSLGYILFSPLMIGAAWFAAPFFVHLFLPKFVSGIPALRIYSLSMFFWSLVQPYHDFLITIKKQWMALPLLVFACLITAIMDMAAIRMGYGITGVAAATLIAVFLQFAATYAVSTVWLGEGLGAIKNFLIFTGAFFYLLISIDVVAFFTGDSPAFLNVLRQGLFFLILQSPFLYKLLRVFPVFSLDTPRKATHNPPTT